MNKRAEEMALKAYPIQDHRKIFGFSLEYSYILNRREAFQEGYEQAEKDTIERACKWIGSLDNGDRIADVKALVNAFRNEMEEV